MLSRNLVRAALPLARLSRVPKNPAARVTALRQHSEGPPADYKHPTMDEMPVPSGSWQENYDNNQRRYNIHLLLGTGFFVITFTVGIYSGAFDLYLLAPEKPSPRLIGN